MKVKLFEIWNACGSVLVFVINEVVEKESENSVVFEDNVCWLWMLEKLRRPWFPLSLSLSKDAELRSTFSVSLSLSLSYPNGGYINGYAGVFGRQILMPSGYSFLEREIVLKKLLQLFLSKTTCHSCSWSLKWINYLGRPCNFRLPVNCIYTNRSIFCYIFLKKHVM